MAMGNKKQAGYSFVGRVALVTALTLLAGRGASAWQTGSSGLRDADKQYAQKSFKRALQGYTLLQKTGLVPPERRDEIAYRIVVSEGKTQQWDLMFANGLDFVKARQHTIWEARGLYWLGRMYLAAPHSGYRVGATIHRGSDVPAIAGDAKPQRVELSGADARNALDALEAAHVRYAEADPTNANRATANERIQEDFDLIHLLPNDPRAAAWFEKRDWLPPGDASWKINPAQPYDLGWPQPKKILYLYAHIQKLAGASPHPHALALFAQALWLRQYQTMMTSIAVKDEHDKPVPIPFPYQNWKPGAALDTLIGKYPEDTLRDEAQYLRAIWLLQEGKTQVGMAALQQFIATRPHSKWVSDARGHLANLRRPSVSVAVEGTPRPGNPVRLNLSYNNVTQIHFDAYRVDLSRLAQYQFKNKDGDQDYENDWMRFSSLIEHRETLSGALQTLNASHLAAWTIAPRVTTPLQAHTQIVTAPLKDAGAYVVVASVPGLRASVVAMVSDLALVQKMDRGRALFYAANARTGKPIAGAKILTKQTWRGDDKAGSAFARGVTDANGLVSIDFLRKSGRQFFQMAAFAQNGNQAAFTPSESGDMPNNRLGVYRGYSVTDRTAYRPGQSVYFRQLLMQRENASMTNIGDLKPLANSTIRVQVTDPQGNLIYKQRTRCSEWGSVSGNFALPDHAALGEYSLQVTLIRQADKDTRRQGDKAKRTEEEEINIDTAGNRFRVEEYKKPEFEVTVTPSAERVKLGQPTSAKIHAAYYFGGPVPGAKVTYRVYRNAYAPSYHFPQPYDYLYNNSEDRDEEDTNYRNGEVVTQGKAQLDAKGDATVTFETKAAAAEPDEEGQKDEEDQKTGDLSYTVEADVQDQSRRTISGTGALKATRHDVAVFLNFAHGYATQGDRVDVEVKTLNPNDRPVSVNGTAHVFRKPNDPKGKETLVTSFPLKTDAQGRAMMQWTATKSGYFRLAFETMDGDGKPVKNSVNVWVDGPELRSQRFLFQGVTLAAKNPYYAPGETAKVLLITPAPDCAVLLTREVEGQILDKRVVRVPGRSLELSVPLTRRDAPNVFVSAVMVRNGEMLQASQELFVPPAQQTATVTVTADKARYAPGETARLNVQALDYRGKPLRAEFSLAIADAALSYIQKDDTPDIRATFYGNRRSNNIQMNGSFEANFEPFAELTLPVKEYPQHLLPMPEGMGQIPVSSGGFGERFRDRAGFVRNDIGGGGADGLITDSLPNEFDSGSVHAAMRAAGRSREVSMKAIAAPAVQIRMSAQSNIEMNGPANPAGVPTEAADFAGAAMKYAPANVNRGDHSRSVRRWVWPTSEDLSGAPTIRSNFRDTAFWTPTVVTNAQGQATVTVKWPDNLTQWRASAVGSTQTVQVGSGETRVTTKKDVLVQLEAPRFLVERDIATLSAIVHNDTEQDARIRVKLDLDNADVVVENAESVFGVGASASGDVNSPATSHQPPTTNHLKTLESWIVVPKGGQQRVDWLVRPQAEGVIHARMSAQSTVEGDATETVIPVLVHGVERQTQQSGVIKTGDTLPSQVTINLPEARKAGSSQVVVTLNPSLAGVMLDALPYLADYPYGCVEQTMSRFLPSIIVANTLKETGYNLGDLEKSAKARAKAAAMMSRDPAQVKENSPYTYPNPNPTGKPNLNTTQYAYYAATARLGNPVFNGAELNRMVKDGMARLRDMQHKDGGWGWWKDDSSDPYMTAYVLYGLMMGQKAGYVTPGEELQRGLAYLKARFLEETDLHQMAYQARVLALVPEMRPALKNRIEGKLFVQREKLGAYSKGLLALALHDMGSNEQARIVLRNLEDTAKIDVQNGTANWDDGDGQWWRWYNNKVETNATILQAYMAIAPDSSLPPMLVKWLVNNRKGSIWRDTHDTALAVNALADWMRVKKELAPDYTLTVSLSDKITRTYRVNHANALFFDNTFVVPDNLLQSGDQTLTITRQGTGTCYYTATTRTFTKEEPIPAAGNELQVSRRYFRLIAGTAGETDKETRRQGEEERKAALIAQRVAFNAFLTGQYERLDDGIDVAQEEGTEQGPTYQRVEVQPGELLNSGDLLEVELGVESKNDYDYVLIEDIKPAGCEPVEVRSGEHAGQGLYANMELRDQKVAFFVSQLPQGRRVLTYRLRAETPGAFHVLPTNSYAMYAPEVRALSNEARLSIRDEETGAEAR